MENGENDGDSQDEMASFDEIMADGRVRKLK
jgi:hypothetical protein